MFTVLQTECPPECPTLTGADLAVEGSGNDYTINTVSKTVTFPAGTTSQTVSISIDNDEDEEFREFFCISVQDANHRANQWWTRIIIPWNDRKKLQD